MRRLVNVLLPVIFIISVLGCSDRPSNRDIEKAVRISLEKKVPATLARYLTGGQDAAIDEIRIIDISKPQGEGENKCWFVKIHTKGSCSVILGGRKEFEGQVEYRIAKDLYDDWKASPNTL